MSRRGPETSRRAPPPQPVNQRLEYIRTEIAGLSKLSEFHGRLVDATAADREEGTAYTYEAVRKYHHNREPPRDYIAAVLAAFPRLNAEWLIRGEGEPLKSSAQLRAEQMRDDTFAAFYRESPTFRLHGIGAQTASGVFGVAVSIAANLIKARGSTWDVSGSEDEAEIVRRAGAALGQALAAPLDPLGLDASQWSSEVKAQYVAGVLSALMVPMEVERWREVARREDESRTAERQADNAEE